MEAFLEYDKRSATFHDDHASLSTVGGRITAEYVLPDENRETPHSEYLFSDDYETRGATLHYREPTDEFSLHVRTTADVDAPEPVENGYEYVSYKAEARDIAGEQVNPQYTSQRCSHTDCGFTARENRPSQERFTCQQCGYEIHADYNAAKNVGFTLLRRLHKTSDGDAPVGVRLNAGTVNESGFTTAPPLVRSGVHGERSAR